MLDSEIEARKPRPSPRDVVAVLQAVGMVLAGTASVVREIRNSRGSHPLRRSRKTKKPMETVTLYRPVGQREWELIAESGYRAFPPRLAHQPIFYPVLNEEYAIEIARDWNTRDAASGFVGYVTRFSVRADFLANYEVKTVGASRHQEYWIPAEDLPMFNTALIGPITITAEFRGVP
ncbi:MAG: hypothetical protein OHK0029_04480 [Armatimonadaceae bacterium]